MKILTTIMKILTTILIVSFTVKTLVAQNTPDAVVKSVNGKALIKKRESKSQKLLTQGEKLYAEDEIFCGKDCKELIVVFCNSPKSVPKNKWYFIWSQNCGPLIGTRSGRSKGDGIILISPINDETIRFENFSLQWKPMKKDVKVDLELRINLGPEIWSKSSVDGAKEIYQSDELLEKLKAAQKFGALSFQISLTEPTNSITNKIVFNLLSLDDENKLKIKLAEIEKESDITLKYVRRGLALSDYLLFGEAVKEFENAFVTVNSNQKNRVAEISTLAIWANYQIYNDSRVKQLCLALNTSDSLPLPCSETN